MALRANENVSDVKLTVGEFVIRCLLTYPLRLSLDRRTRAGAFSGRRLALRGLVVPDPMAELRLMGFPPAWRSEPFWSFGQEDFAI